MKLAHIIVASILTVFIAAGPVKGQSLEDQRQLVNEGVVKVLGGSVSGTYSKLVWDMTILFDEDNEMRVLPILGKGSFKGIQDLILLKGIDAALVQSDVLTFIQDYNIYPNISNLISYINVFYNEEVHLIAKNDIKSIEDLEGKRVNFGPTSSGTFMTSGILFDALGVTVEATSESYQDALQMLRNDEIEAFVRVAGAPVKLLEGIAWEEGLHIVPLPKIDGPYYEASVSHEQYPGLVPLGENVNTVAVASVLAAYNWPQGHPRRKPVDKLYTALKDRVDEFKREPFHPKWQQVEFDRELPGWKRWEISEPQS